MRRGEDENPIIGNAVWYFSDQTYWGWSAHLGAQKAGTGLPDVNDPIIDLGVGEITNNLSLTWYLFHEEFDKIHPLISKRLKQELTNKSPTSSNLITCCKVSEVKPGLLKFEGDGFAVNMTYNSRVVKPTIDYIEVKDRSLMKYWPKGVTQVKLEFIKPGLKGGQEVIFTPSK